MVSGTNSSSKIIPRFGPANQLSSREWEREPVLEPSSGTNRPCVGNSTML